METELLATKAEIVIDPRLAEVWQLAWDCAEGAATRDSPGSESRLGCLLRLAYLQGYADSAAEAGTGGLWRELGIREPVARAREAGRSRGARRRSRSSDR
jgi:hypothetical protein